MYPVYDFMIIIIIIIIIIYTDRQVKQTRNNTVTGVVCYCHFSKTFNLAHFTARLARFPAVIPASAFRLSKTSVEQRIYFDGFLYISYI